jgi:predicted MFS family arabinose efflux permease
VSAEKRVGLAAVVLMTYGVGATIGPMIAGALMRAGGPNMLYVFSSVCALILVLLMWQPKWTR